MTYIIGKLAGSAPVVLGTCESSRHGRQLKELAKVQSTYPEAELTLSEELPPPPDRGLVNTILTEQYYMAERKVKRVKQELAHTRLVR